MNLYQKNGYVDIRRILNVGTTFNFVLGGRGTGKTYTSLLTCLEDRKRIMFMRRTQAQADLVNKAEFSPYKAINSDLGINVESKAASKYNSVFRWNDDIVGYSCALSTISNLRGFDASDVDILIYDEFISELHERPLKNEASAFLNAYETMNRNRELKGKDPMKVLCLANAFNIANPIFLELELVGIAEKMKEQGRDVYINRNRSVSIFFLDESEISQKKSKTALYKLTEGSEYSRMALANDFVYNPRDNIKSMPLREYDPLVTVGEITIYRHKAQRKYYVSEHRTGDPKIFKTDEISLKRYRNQYGINFFEAYMRNNFIFENILTKSLFELYTI